MAQQSEQLKSDFLSQVSHELRTPITSIYGFAKLIKKDFDTIASNVDINASLAQKQGKIKQNISIIICECSRLTRMINNVLDLEKIESGETTWHDAPIPLLEVINSSMTAVWGLILEKEAVKIDSDISSNLPVVVVDADLITQVLVNLLSNAIKFSDSGVVMIRATRELKSISISVSDEGGGINPDDVDRIFEKYYISRKGNTLNSPRLGTGLGLPICKQIVEHYGGEISVESKLGVGSTFHIVLPESIIHS